MKKRCAGLAIVLLSLVAIGVVNAQIPFHGVINSNGFAVDVNTAILVMGSEADTLSTPGWGTGGGMDTFDFPDITRWPDTVVLIGTVDGQPNTSHFPMPEENQWYRFEWAGIVAPEAMFFSQVGVEEPRSAIEARPCLNVSPSVVTGKMTVRVQATGNPTVDVLDAVGNLVRTLNCTDGAATWSRDDGLGRLVPEGVYFCRYATSEAVAVRKVLVAH
jgi:hypothetical protein